MDEKFRSLYNLDIFESLIWTERYIGYGNFEFYTPVSNNILKVVDDIQKKMEYKDDCYAYLDDTKNIMVIEDIEITTDTETGNHLIVSGRGLESLLERRIIWDKTTINGNLQNGVKKLITEAVINPAISDRKIPDFVFKESNNEYIKNLTLRAQYTGDNLYDTLLTICSANKLGFDVCLNAANQFEFMLTMGENRSYDQLKNPYVIFSTKFENIVNSDYLESGKTLKNVTLVAGEGEGVDRTRLVVGNASGLRRKELYTDARDIQSESYSQQLEEDKETLENYKQDLEEIQQALEEETKTFADETREFNKKKSEYNELKTDYETRISHFNTRIAYYNEQITSYENSLNSTQKTYLVSRTSNKNQSEAYQKLITACNNAINAYNDKLSNERKLTYAKLVQYEEGIDSEEKKRTSYEDQKKPYDEAKSEAEKNLPDYKTKLEDYETKISKYQGIISEDQSSLSDETKNFNELTSEFNEKTTEHNQLVSAYQSRISQDKQEISKYEEKIDQDQKELNELYADLLTERGLEKLSENQYTKVFTGEVDAVKTFVYGVDFFKGDIVQIANEYGMEAKVRVSEVVRAQDTTGYKTYPTFEVIE